MIFCVRVGCDCDTCVLFALLLAERMASSASASASASASGIGKRRRSEDAPSDTFLGAFAALRSIADRVQTALVNLTTSTEARRQQIAQQRLHQHEAVDGRAAALQALVRDESLVRTSHLERQLCDIGKAEDALRQEQSVLESPSDELTQSITLLPSVAVEVDTIAVQLDPAPVLHAISQFGVVFGAQPATMLFDRAFALLLGRDGKKDAAAAFTTFEDAAAQGNTTAMGYAATLLYHGFGIKQDKVRAQQMYTEAAKHGDLYSRAMAILLDKRVAEYGDVFLFLRHAASTGHVMAADDLGVCFYNGLACESKSDAAADYFRQAADQGYAVAQLALATCYENGTGVEKNLVQAASLYRLAADQGYARAQFDLGMCFKKGRGVDKDPMQAAVWCQRAADQGDAEAQRVLAACFKSGVGVNKDIVQAAVWFRRAADQGDAIAQNELGVCYNDGNGVGKDPIQAAMWYCRAADQGYANAQLNIGRKFYQGAGVIKDFVQAVKWFTLAAAQGNASAHHKMGVCYETGNGVAKSWGNALSSYQRAADLGNDMAKQRLAKFEAAFFV